MMIDKRKQPIEIVQYDPKWPEWFDHEKQALNVIFQQNFATAHHIGSTAIPNMPAKPTIDILLVVHDIELVDNCNDAMLALGYKAWGEYHIKGRRFFVKGDDKRTHHVHTFQIDSHDIARHLAFRDYLIAHPDEAKNYAHLKQSLAKQFSHNRRNYVLGKQDYVKTIEQKALAWISTDNNGEKCATTGY